MMHGFLPPDRYFAYLTWPLIDELPDKANTVIVQPIGAIEQHGPHLPLAVDAATLTPPRCRFIAMPKPTAKAAASTPESKNSASGLSATLGPTPPLILHRPKG